MPENIDMLKLEADLKSQRLARFLKNKNNLVSMSILLAGEMSGILQGFPANLFVNIAAPIVMLRLFYAWKDNSYIINDMASVVRNSLEYKECSRLYDEFIRRVANLIRDMGYSNSMEAVLYFDAFQNGGILSQDSNNVYYNYKYDRVMTTELLGARMASGRCVCRHYASFAADIFSELGLVASPLMVKREESCNPEERLRNPFITWTHALVGIAEGDKKYLYDPTSSLFADKSDFSFKDERYSGYVAKPTGDEFAGHYLIYPGNRAVFNRKYKEISYAIGALPLMRLDKEELKCMHEKIEATVTKRIDDIVYFYQSNKKLMREIAELECAISPHGDEPIEKWILAKTK